MLRCPFLRTMVFLAILAGCMCRVSAEVEEFYINDGWTFYWDKIYTQPPSADAAGGEKVTIPSSWKHSKFGYGTYCRTITGLDPEWKYAFYMNKSPGTASSIYVNGICIVSAGSVSTTAHDGIPCVKPLIVSFMPDKTGTADIAVVVSNYTYRKAGMWDTVLFGRESEIRKKYNMRIFISSFISGTLLFLFIVNFMIFLLNRQRRDNFYYALLAFMMTARVITRKFALLLLLFPQFPYGIARRLEYLIIWAGPPVFFMLVDQLIPELHINRRFRNLSCACCVCLGSMSIVLPIKIGNYLVTPMVCFAVFLFLWFSAILIKTLIAIRKKIIKKTAGQGDRQLAKAISILIAMLVLIVAGFSIEYVNTLTYKWFSFNIILFFFLAFAVIQLLFMSCQQSKLYDRSISKTLRLRQLSSVYEYFVPMEFLRLLNKRNVVAVERGNHVETDMVILFLKTNVDSDMEKQFDMFSSFCEKAIALVSKRNGFVSKFNSSGLMALFPNKNAAFDAVQCAFDLNICASDCGIKKTGIGVHYGKMIVGTIGEERRLDDTVISDTVNTSFRFMQISFARSIPIIVSGPIVILASSEQSTDENGVVSADTGSEKFLFKSLDYIPVKGKNIPLQMYECKRGTGV